MKRCFVLLPGVVLLVLLTSCTDTSYPFIVATDAVDVNYTIDADGTVDVMVENSYMVTVRSLLSSAAQEAGQHMVTWDLLDEGGDYPGDGLYTVEVYLDGERVFVQVLEVNRQ